MKLGSWRAAACLCGLLAGTGACHAQAPGSADALEQFRNQVDNRLAVRTSLGVRSAYAVSDRQVQVAIGASVSRAAGVAEAWRIISYDDANYAYEKFVKPTAAAVRQEREAPGVAGSPFPAYERTIVTLDLSTPLKQGVQYYVMGQGVNGEVLTAAHTAGGFVYEPGAEPPDSSSDVDLAVLGLRGIEPVGPGLIRLEFGANFSAEAATSLENYTLSVNGEPVKVTAMGRRTMLDTYIPTGWPYVAIPKHDVFLQLERPLADGQALQVEVSPAVAGAANKAQLRFGEKASVSNSIKVNQVGYLTDSPVKVAYLGRWMGSFPEGGEPRALSFAEAPRFEVCSEKDGAVAFTGEAKLIHRSGEKNEGFHKVDHSGENVYLLDFTALKTPGRYFVSVPGVGRSIAFDVGDDAYVKAFEVQAYGVFAQRCGFELKPPHSEWHRIACHNTGIVPTSQVHGERHSIRDLKDKVIEGAPKIMAYGGHHDAGDYNPRSHIDVAQSLMDAYEIAPRKFYDGQLNIPEKGNGVPDILDEAFWAIRLWIDLQDEDGGVHNGTESAGDPNFMETVELDRVGDYAYAKDAPGSYTFAGVMAQASRLWRSVGKTSEADDFLARAVRAYEWAGRQAAEGQHKDEMAYAAAQLLKTTGDERYDRDFLAAAIWSTKPDAEIDEYRVYDQSFAALVYATCDEKLVDTKVQEAARKAIIRRADWFIANAETMAYAFIRHPQAPINWGTGAYENYLPAVIWAWRLSGDEKYRYWMVRTCDNTLGANPMGISWVKGLGQRTVHAPLHNSRYSHIGEVHPGAQVEGPVQSGEGYRVKDVAYPPIQTDFAVLYTYVDAHFAIAMNELVVPAQAKAMATFGLLLPDRQ